MSTLVRHWKLLGFAALVAGGAAALPGVAAAACSGTCSATETITLTASVAANCTLALTGTAPPLTLTGNGTATVATVVETCNAKGGYNVKIRSLNGSKLKGGTGNTDELVYTLTYDGVAPNISTANTYSADVFGTLQGKTDADGVERPVQIAWTGSYLTEDTYTDTITVSLVAP
jgi:hypothetical protein